MKNPFLKPENSRLISDSTAEQLLTSVFIACGREPNSVPLEALTSYSNYRKERYALQRTVIALILVLFLLLPLLFLAARVHVTLANPGDRENPVYSVSVHSIIPIRHIQATLGGQTVPIYEDAPGEYTLSPRDNGDMQISVMLLNRQLTAVDVTVLTADSDAPQLVSTEFDESCVYFFVEDESGVDYAAVSIADEAGAASPALSFDTEAGRIAVPYPDSAINVRIPDTRGNVLQVLLKPQP